jgi:hypothetical protein
MNITRSFTIIVICLASLGTFYYFIDKNNNPNEIQWIDSANIQQGPIRRDSLSEIQISKIMEIYKVMGKYDGQPIEKWIDDFKRDMNPDREIAILEAMASAMVDVENRMGFNDEKKRESYKIVLMSSMAPYDQAKDHIKIPGLSEEEIIEIYKLFGKYYNNSAQQGDAPEPASPAR